MSFRLLLSGHDTIECAYYLAPTEACLLDYGKLAAEKEALRQSKTRKPTHIKLGSEEFLLAGHGTRSGYPFLIENEAFSIQFGEFNKPSFFVTFRSIALWHSGAQGLHDRFLSWARSVGLGSYLPERLSRVDFTFDYHLPVIDFDEDSFVTNFVKDNQHRKNRQVQTFSFGASPLMLRIYNKCDEIQESSAKTWFYDLWGMEQEVWRFEWEVRKEWLRTVGILTFEDLQERQGDLLRLLVNDHTTLRIRTNDDNRSRWPVHPLWLDLQARVAQMAGLGVVRELDMRGLLDEREMRIAISVYGYLKRIAAIRCMQDGLPTISHQKAAGHLAIMLNHVHDSLTWDKDVERRVTEMRLGEW
ncbi:MAG TPA: hypothetical protein VMV91_03040 [Rhodocyclaceae bacterium]|nr:hypothetical protein [Rhodocyclaceae bacterium]